MGNTIYIILGVVVVIYLFISVTNRRQHKERKSKKFMEGYKRKESKEIEE